jgi:uncharacterized membrane protein
MDAGTVIAYVYIALWLFFIYGFAGVVVEMLYCWTIEYRGVIESRLGLLYLPINPLYGAGGVVISLVLVPFFDNPFAVFGLGLVTGTVLEYFTSLIMEKAFGAVYWDYSNEFLNVHGRICLKYAIFWGLLSLVLLYVLDVINIGVLAMIPVEIGLPVLGLLILATIASSILTLLAYRRVDQKNTYLKAVRDGKDATLPDPGWARLVDRLVPDSVLINTFPRMSLVTEYQQLPGQHRKVWYWSPSIGKSNADRVAARERAEQQLEAGAARVGRATAA